MQRASVVVPVFNAPELAVATVQSILDQTFADFEVIVVDDGSQPATRAALAPLLPRVRYYWQENRGQAAAKNRGIAEATGEIIAFCDHDDLWSADKLARHMALHAARPELVLTFSQVAKLLPDGITQQPIPAHGCGPDALASLLRKSLIPTSSAVVVCRDALARAGPFRESLRIADDYDLWFRLARLGPFGFVREPLVRYRVHSGNLTHKRIELHLEWADILGRLYADRAYGGYAQIIRRKLVYHLVSLARRLAKGGRHAESDAALRRALTVDRWSWKARRNQLRLRIGRLLRRRDA